MDEFRSGLIGITGEHTVHITQDNQYLSFHHAGYQT